MATINFISGRIISPLKNDGTLNAGGMVRFFEPDGTFSTAKTTYTTSALLVPNANPLILDSLARGVAFFQGNADVKFSDSADVLIYNQRDINPPAIVSSVVLSTNTTLTAAHNGFYIEVTGTTTLSLTAASALGAGWNVKIINTGSGVITLARLNAGNTINGVAANTTIPVGTSSEVYVISAATGFTANTPPSLSGANTWTGANAFNNLGPVTSTTINTWTGVNTWTADNSHTGIETFSQGIGPSYIQNIGLSATVAAKALTLALKTVGLVDPSSVSPQQTAFRSVTATNGNYLIRSVTSALSLVVPSGASLGFKTIGTGHIYVYELDVVGVVEIACSQSIFDEGRLQSTTAISAASTLGTVLYSITARSNVPVRLIGRVVIQTGGIPGEWDNSPTNVAVMPGLIITPVWKPWFPTFSFSGGTTGMSAITNGIYMEEGVKITAAFSLTLTTKGSSTGTAQLSNLPYTAGNNNIAAPGPLSLWSGMGLSYVYLVGATGAGSSVMTFYGATAAAATLQPLSDTGFANGSALVGYVTYFRDSF